MFRPQLLGVLARARPPVPACPARSLATSAAVRASPAPGLPPQNAPADQKATTLSHASRTHHDLVIDPELVVAPNADAAATAREAAVAALPHKPRHAGENPPGVPPQALKRAPETFNIKIPFPTSRTAQPQPQPLIPLINPVDPPPAAQEAIRKPTPVLAVADDSRVHAPAAAAGLGAEDGASGDSHAPRVARLTQAGVPEGWAHQAVVLYDKAQHHFYSVLPNGVWAPVQPVPGAKGPDGKTVFQFSPGVLPRPMTEAERSGAVILFGLLTGAFVLSIGLEAALISQESTAVHRAQQTQQARLDQLHKAEQPL